MQNSGSPTFPTQASHWKDASACAVQRRTAWAWSITKAWGSAGEGMIFVAENRDFRHEKIGIFAMKNRDSTFKKRIYNQQGFDHQIWWTILISQ